MHGTNLHMIRTTVHTVLCDKVCPGVESVKYRNLHPKASIQPHLRMKHLELDAPYFFQNLVANSCLRQFKSGDGKILSSFWWCSVVMDSAKARYFY